jgi:hypothetical protein
MSVDREWILGQLREALVALSLPGSRALAARPAEGANADELALDYDHFLTVTLQHFSAELTSPQRAALERVNHLLEEMSGRANADLWTEAAVREHPKWVEVRKQAGDARRVLGWGEVDATG